MEKMSHESDTVFYFTEIQHAFNNIKRDRIKLSRLREVNDPFEARPTDFSDHETRGTWHHLKKCIDSRFPFICFSKSFRSPLMWAHYARRNYGCCVEYQIKKYCNDEYKLLDIEYRSFVDYPAIHVGENFAKISISDAAKFLSIKNSCWRYEKERRLLVSRNKTGISEEDGHLFINNKEFMNPTRIILGYRSDNDMSKFNNLKELAEKNEIELIYTKPALRGNRIVHDESKNIKLKQILKDNEKNQA
ncbi:MAG: DUF2971 domain-containing protein [Fibrobacteres bacterium]|nr:DUF2971 domain-containing protein [Fibrobacterota bacterium]